MTLKSSVSAQVLNDDLTLRFGADAVDVNDPTSWKYYMNLAGEYHPRDTMMYVTSLDTLQEIQFTKENLAIHANTRDAYVYGTRYYLVLTSQYPDQEDLIRGIIMPANMDEAIAAEDNTILSWETSLVERQEYSLIQRIQEFAQTHYSRWFLQAYVATDAYFPMSYYGVLAQQMVSKLINLREAAQNTPEVHSFYIQNYLASHGKLDKYLPYLTLRQSLYLYRNLIRLLNQAGQTGQFEELIDRILTERQIPLSSYSLRQLRELNAAYRPNVIVKNNPLNERFNANEGDYITLENLEVKEETVVYGTKDWYDIHRDQVLISTQSQNTAVIKTKDLDSSMVDYNDSSPDTLVDVCLRNWVYMTINGLYSSAIPFTDPTTGDDHLLPADQAFLYWYYLCLRTLGFDIQTFPPFYLSKVTRVPKPTVSQILKVVPPNYPGLNAIAQELYVKQPQPTTVLSTEQFFKYSKQVYDRHTEQWIQIANTWDMRRRGYVENMVLQMYVDSMVEVAPSSLSVEDFLANNNLPVYNFTQSEAMELIGKLFAAGTGLSIDEANRTPAIQKAMIEIMRQLSSYSVQYMYSINSTNVIPVDWAGTRVSEDLDGKSETEIVDRQPIRVIGVTGSVAESLVLMNAAEDETMVEQNLLTMEYQDEVTLAPALQPTISALKQIPGLQNFVVVGLQRL